jgi:hypothetical protein
VGIAAIASRTTRSGENMAVSALRWGRAPAATRVIGPALVTAAMVLAAPAATAGTIYVSPGGSIQAGIDAAVDGDVVIVIDGTYTGVGNRDIDFGGRLITVRSLSGDPALCIVDCQGLGRGFVFQNAETADAVLEGFTIRNGSADNGGGILVSGTCPEPAASPTIRRCVLENNQATGLRGGGLFNKDCANPLVIDCRFTGNTASVGGGMANSANGDPLVVNCVFEGNAATGARGGAVNNSNSSPTLVNCTSSGNTAAGGTGGMFTGMSLTPPPVVTNCIFWGDTPPEIGGGATITYSDIEGLLPDGSGNIDLDPTFVDAPAGDLRLKAGSPAIDVADNTALAADVELDAAGAIRFFDDPDTPDGGVSDARPPLDMGAYEFQGAGCLADCAVPADGVVDVTDLLETLADWGLDAGCDVDGSGDIDRLDILAVLLAWGACP